MSGDKNLIRLSSEEAREYGSRGGKKSAEVRRKKKALRECMKCLLDMPVSSEKHYAVLERFGFEPDEINNRTLLATSLFVNAVEKGNVAAFQEIKDLDMSVEEKNESIPFILPATVIAAPFLSVYRDVIQLKLGTNIFAYKKRITEVNIGYENNIETIEPVFGDDEKEIIQEV